MRKSAARGFSLIELLTVIAVIAFLIGTLMVVFLKQGQNAKERGAKALVDRIGIALQQYYGDFRAYPPDSGFGVYDIKQPATKMSKDKQGKEVVVYDPGTLWRYLGRELVVKRASDGLEIGRKDAYIKFTQAELKAYEDPVYGKSHIVVDPWGEPLGYIGSEARKLHQRDGVDIFSCGPDRVTASNDKKDNGIPQDENQAYDGEDNDGDGIIDDANELGEAKLNGALTRFKTDKKVGSKESSQNEVLDDINSWEQR